MGIYLNSSTAYTLYKNETKKPYFVDKTLILEQLFPLVDEGTNYICITRPRRFGKTVMANMIASFFSKAQDAADIFDCLKISQDADYQIYRNKYNVIHIFILSLYNLDLPSYLTIPKRIWKGAIFIHPCGVLSSWSASGLLTI